MAYIAQRAIQVQKADGSVEMRKPGDAVPEAADWPNASKYVQRGIIVPMEGTTVPRGAVRTKYRPMLSVAKAGKITSDASQPDEALRQSALDNPDLMPVNEKHERAPKIPQPDEHVRQNAAHTLTTETVETKPKKKHRDGPQQTDERERQAALASSEEEGDGEIEELRKALNDMPRDELQKHAKKLGLDVKPKHTRADLIGMIIDFAQEEQNEEGEQSEEETSDEE